MAVLFSAVTITSDSDQAEFLVAGIPKSYADLEGWTAFESFMNEVDTEQDIKVHRKEIVYKERCHPLRNGIHRSYSVGFVFVHLKKDLVELLLLLLGFCREELVAGKRNIFLSAVLLTV